MSETDEHLDVAVIGAGIVGIACALRLQDENRAVTLIERGEIARGASSGNAGMLAFSEILPLASPGIMRRAPRWLLDPLGPLSVPPRYAARISPWLWRFWRESRPDRVARATAAKIGLMQLAKAEMERLVRDTGLGGMIRENGTLDLYESDAAFAAAAPEREIKTAAGFASEHLAGSAIAECQPGLSPRFRHGVFSAAGQAVSDPHDFAAALAARFAQRGGRVLQAAVSAVRPEAGGAVVCLPDGRTIRARHVVVACGAWSKPLAAGLGDRVPLETERGYNTSLPPGSFELRRQLYFDGHGFVVTPLDTGIRIGGAVELGGLRAPPNFKRAEAMLAKAARFMPGLRTEGGRQWMGFRPSMPDSLPVIGRSTASAAVIYAFGHGHYGLTQSAATGRLVADLLAGRDPPVPTEPFRPQRFRGAA